MSQPIVSVIMPVYNNEKYLEQCLNSIIHQTLKNIEIICVDDGSDDRSPEILKSFAARDSRIKLLHQENAGAGAARNLGLKHAIGTYLSFLDSDDFFEPDMLELAVEKIESDNADFAVFRCDQYLNDTNQYKSADYAFKKHTLPPYTPFYFREITDNIFKTFVGWAWDKLYRREFVIKKQLKFQEQRTSNDLLFVFSGLVLAEKITYVDKVLAHQRRNNSESLSNTREKSWFCFYQALWALKQVLTEHDLYEELKRDFINYALHFCLWNLNTISGNCYSKLYTKLRESWFQELEITGHNADYFYMEKEYRQFQKIMKYTFEEYETKISVVIPVYNAEKYIRQCLESVLHNQNISLEVICVDDASTDQTPGILKEYQQRYSNVKVIRNKKNIHAGSSRNLGLRQARGQYIHFLDADDTVVAHAYEKLYNLADKNDLDWLKTTVIGIDDQTGEEVKNRLYELRDVDRGFDEKLLEFERFPGKFFDIAVVPWNGIYNRQFLLKNNIQFNQLFCVNDRSFYVSVCVKGKRKMITRTLFIRHRVNVSNSLIDRRAQHFDCQLESYLIMEQICNENNVSEKVRFEILEHEMRDIFVWYRKFIENDTLSEEMKNRLRSFLSPEKIHYFEQFGKNSRWLEFRDLIEV